MTPLITLWLFHRTLKYNNILQFLFYLCIITGVTAVTPIQQANIDKEYPGKNIVLNACCPGFVNTDLTGGRGKLTIDEGAETPVYLALLPQEQARNIRGCFLFKKEVYNWKEGQYPKIM